MKDYREILESIGYSLTDDGKHYRAKPLYRDSDNCTVLCINKDNGSWFDFKTSEGGPFEKLVGKTVNISSGDVSGWLRDRNFSSEAALSEVIKIIIEDTVFDDSVIKALEQDFSYWKNR